MSAAPVAVPSPAAGRPGLPTIARGSLLNLVGAGVTALAGLVLVVVVTRSVPQSTAGRFFALTSLFLLAEMIACLGTGTGLVYFTARVRTLGQPERVRQFLRVALTPVLVFSVAAAAVLAIWSPLFARVAGGGHGTPLAVVVLGLLLPAAVLSDTLLAATRGHGTMLPTVAVEKTGRQVVQLALVALAVGSGALWLVSAAWALPWVLSGVLAWWWLTRLNRRHGAATPAGEPVDLGARWREFWTFTWPRAVNSVVQLALQRLDIVLITVLIGPAHAAVYTAATRFLVVGQQSSTSIGNAAQPRLAGVLAVHDRASAKAIYQSATGWVVLTSWPLYLLVAVFGEVVLRLFGHGYGAGLPVVEVLTLAMLVATACGMVDMLLNMAGRTSWTLMNSIVALAVMVTVDVLLIPRMGILGAGIGWAAAILANNLLPLTQLFVSMRLHPFGPGVLTAVALSAGCFGVLPGVVRLALPGSPLAQAGAVVVGLLLFVAGLLRWRRALALPGLGALRRRAGRHRRPSTAAASPDAAATPEGAS